MTTTLVGPLTDYLQLDAVTDAPAVAPGRWPLAGLVAGVAVFASTTILHAPFIRDPEVYEAGPEAVYAALSGQLITQLGAAAGYLAAFLLIPFGIGLVKTLARRAPDRLGMVVAAALALAAGVATTISAYAMKSVLASGLPGHMDNAFYTHVDTAVSYTIAGQIQYAGWLPVVAAAGIVGVLAWQERLLPRFLAGVTIGMASAVGLVTVALNLPWSAGLVAPVWLLGVSVTALVLRRRGA